MTYYVALDVGLRMVSLCIVDEAGGVKLEKSLPSEIDDIVACLRDFGEEIACVGLEAGTLTQWLTYGLRAAGFKPVVLEARHVQAALAAMRNKTDRNDARGIAQILRTGWYRPVHVKSIESHYIRTLLAARKALLRKCIDLENEVRGLLKVFGIKLTPGLRHGAFDRAVREPIEANEMDRRVKVLAQADQICRLFMTAPGVGYIAALTFKSPSTIQVASSGPRPSRRISG